LKIQVLSDEKANMIACVRMDDFKIENGKTVQFRISATNKGGHIQELEIKDELWKLDPSTRIQEIKNLIGKK
jgi:hypothetical protein